MIHLDLIAPDRNRHPSRRLPARLPPPTPVPRTYLTTAGGQLNRDIAMVVRIENYKETIPEAKNRTHPGLNRGPFGLQPNALPLSYESNDTWRVLCLAGTRIICLSCLFEGCRCEV